MLKYIWSALLLLGSWKVNAQSSGYKITIDLTEQRTEISPMLYGHFIEYLGRCIDGGIYEENSELADARSFRMDVLEKVQGLDIPLLRFPGGTVIKTYHWEDGIGPKDQRPKRPNLIWGGVNDNHFGTAEFIEYCKEIGAAPFLVVNMSTATAEEAANWVEYCNGTEDTYWANLRREHGYEEPFNVKYWGIGNEEYAEPDAGLHQDVDFYIKDAWQFVKLMKLQDPSLKMTLVGTSHDLHWSKRVLEEMGPVCDFLSIHLYAIPADTSYQTLIKSVETFENDFDKMRPLLAETPQVVKDFSPWYRFPPREEPVKLAVDEWGIWDLNSGAGKGDYQMEYTYHWGHAMAVGKFINLFMENADIIGLATWAQTVNVLAPIMTNEKGAFLQTIYTPLKAYRQYVLPQHLAIKREGESLFGEVQSIDATASISQDGKEIVLAVLNLDPSEEQGLELDFAGGGAAMEWLEHIIYSAPSLDAVNDFNQQVVEEEKVMMKKNIRDGLNLQLKPASINFIRLKVRD
ncbi:alpha-L-arabinofuranosidase C-terminal domain-containing protein [Echinicola salinicaeni]|uniref:alpha-L-arabinofuranosidase C-terminal domain-containing protein n=1 Tax=Echinicola salinicaeni TaxID=2762757 RepID=UPI001649235A|nr:alpha-L-arabinofuranosidase C-terminal domain-containing protein [Echinicola salinicaeni]